LPEGNHINSKKTHISIVSGRFRVSPASTVKRFLFNCNLMYTHWLALNNRIVGSSPARGTRPKVISEALGHASVAFTMDTYSHIIWGMQEDMIALLDDVLPAGKSGADDSMTLPTIRQVNKSLSGQFRLTVNNS